MIEIRNIEYPKWQTVLLSNIKNTVCIINNEIKTMTTANRNKILKEREKKSIRNALIDDPIYKKNLIFSPFLLKVLNSAIESGIYSNKTLGLCKEFLGNLNIHMIYLRDLTIDHPMKTYWNPFYSERYKDECGNFKNKTQSENTAGIKITEAPKFLCFYIFINGLLDFIRYIDKAFEIVGHIPIVRSRMQDEYTSFTHPELDYKIHYQNWNSNITPRNTSEYVMLVTRERLCDLLKEHVSSMYFYELRADDIKKKITIKKSSTKHRTKSKIPLNSKFNSLLSRNKNYINDNAINLKRKILIDLIENSSFFEKLQKKESLKSSSGVNYNKESKGPGSYYYKKYYPTDKSFIKIDKKIIKTRDFKKNFGKIIRLILDKNSLKDRSVISKWLCLEMDFTDSVNSMKLSDYNSIVNRESVVKHFIGMNHICSMKWGKSQIIKGAIHRIIIGYQILMHKFVMEPHKTYDLSNLCKSSSSDNQSKFNNEGCKELEIDMDNISNNISELRYITWVLMHDTIPLLTAIEEKKWISDEQILSFDNGIGFCKIYPSTERTKTYDELFDPCYTLHSALKKKMIFNCKLDMIEKLFLKSMPILFEVRQYDKNLSEFSEKSSLYEVKDFILDIIRISISGLYRHNFHGKLSYIYSHKSTVDDTFRSMDIKSKGKNHGKEKVFVFKNEFNFIEPSLSESSDHKKSKFFEKNEVPGHQNHIFSQENLKFSRFIKIFEIFKDSDSKDSIYKFFSDKYKLLRKIIQEYLCASLLKNEYILSCVEKFLITNKDYTKGHNPLHKRDNPEGTEGEKKYVDKINNDRKIQRDHERERQDKQTKSHSYLDMGKRDGKCNRSIYLQMRRDSYTNDFIIQLRHENVIKSTLEKLFIDIKISRYIFLDIAIQTTVTGNNDDKIIWEFAFFNIEKSKFVSVINKINKKSYINTLKFCLNCVKETHNDNQNKSSSLTMARSGNLREFNNLHRWTNVTIRLEVQSNLEDYSLEKKIIQETNGIFTLKESSKEMVKSKNIDIKTSEKNNTTIDSGLPPLEPNNRMVNKDLYYSKLRMYKLDIIDFLISNIEAIDLWKVANILPNQAVNSVNKTPNVIKSITRAEFIKFEKEITLEIKQAIPKIMKRTFAYFNERKKNNELSPPGGCMYKSELSDGINWISSEFKLNKKIADKISDICYMYENRESSRKILSKIQEYIIYTVPTNGNKESIAIGKKKIFNNMRDFIFVRIMLQIQKRHNQIKIIPKNDMNCKIWIKCIIALQHRFKVYINSCSLSPEEYSLKIKKSLAHIDKISGAIVTNCCNRVASVTGFENFGSNYIYNRLSMEEMSDMLYYNRNPFQTKYLRCCLSLSKKKKNSHLSSMKETFNNGKNTDTKKSIGHIYKNKAKALKNEYNPKQFVKTLCKNMDSEINECGKVFDNRVFFVDILNNNILASVSSENCNTGEYNSKDISKSWGSTGSSRWRLNYMFCLCHDCGCFFKRSSVYYNMNETVPNLCDRCIYIDTKNSIVSYCSFSDKIKYLSKKEAISHAVKIDKLSLMDVPIDFSMSQVQGMTKFSSSQWKKTKTFEDSFMKENEKLLISRTPLVFIRVFNHKKMHFERKQISLELYMSKIFPRMTTENNLIYLKNSEGFKESFIYSFIYDKFNRDSIFN